MRIIVRLAIIAAALSHTVLAQAPRTPVPRGKDSAAVTAILTRHVKATGADTVKASMRYAHYKQQMEMAGAPPVEMEFFVVQPAPGKTNMRARSLVNMPMMGLLETVVNGDDGWVVAPGGGPPMLIDKNQQKQLIQSGNPDPLDGMASGTLTLAKRATIAGREMDGVRYTDSLGTDMVVYFDRRTGLASAVRSASPGGMEQDTSMVVHVTEYKTFGGVAIPTLIRIVPGRGSPETTMRVMHVDFAPVDTMMFVPPPAVAELIKQKKP